MSSNGTKTIIWANGEDVFCIAKVGHILELEEKCDAGIAQIMNRLGDGTWRLNDIRETVRLGLIGGGMDSVKAMIAVKRHVDENPLAQSVLLAYEILTAALVGVAGEELEKKPEAETAPLSTARTGGSAEQPSSNSAQEWDVFHQTFTNVPSGKLPPVSKDTTEPKVQSSSPSL